jgi:phospholipid/cholesterol/gamma-HCH transport system permease protein
MTAVQTVGRVFLAFLEMVGQVAVFTLVAISHCLRPPFYFRLIGRQMMEIGYYSLPVIALTTLFAGMVLALQSYTGFARNSVGAESAIAEIVVLSITRELGPVLAGLMVAARVGSSIAAEIGTMRVTEQIDALVTLSTNPYKYLVTPRVLAGVFTMPLLIVVGDIIGVFGGYIVSIYKLGFNPTLYLKTSWDKLYFIDVSTGLVKAAVFGFIVTLMGCYQGYHSRGGAQGVGTATINSVVSSSILILILNYLISAMFFGT